MNEELKMIGDAIMSSPPAWYDADGKINEYLLVNILIDKHGLSKHGEKIQSQDGVFLRPETLRKLITDEIFPFVPHDTARRVAPIYNLLRDTVPEVTDFSVDTITAADLNTKSLTPPKFIIDKLLPCGLCVLAAPPKTGKSWLCLALADAIATGSTFFGNKTDKGTVLYAALEDSQFRLKDRLLRIGSMMSSNLHLICKGVPRIDEGLDSWIRSFVKQYPDTRCVIIDTIARVKSAAAGGLNAYEADTKQFQVLQELALEKNIAVLCITHFSKLKQYSNADDPFERITGSTGLLAVADACWLIYGKRGSEEMIFNTTGRDIFYSEAKIQFDKEKCRWIMLGDSEELEEQRRLDKYNSHPVVKTIRQLISESGGRWSGSSEMLDDEIIRRTETVPPAGRELKSLLYDYKELFLSQDHIAFTKGSGGRAGRNYTFERTRQTELQKD